MAPESNIAIIGMGCVYPGAQTPEALWENILAGRRYFRITPDERLPNEYYYHPDPEVLGKTYCNRMAVISDWSFDPTEWRIPPITFNQSEIVHWLALHTANEALQAAKIDFSKTDKRRVGVVLGNSGSGEFHRSYLLRNRWPFVERAVRRAVEKDHTGKQADTLIKAIRYYYESPFPETREDQLSGIMGNVIAGRIANYYDFRSAAYTVDGACASSLLAVINACNHIDCGDMDVALCGGVDVSLDPLEMVGFAKTQALAKEDIRPYDERAAGIQTGEGCGILVLASEKYARLHGYHIHALVKGWGTSADGSGGITQPKVEGQQYAIQKAYQRAGYSIASVDYIEGHGTGTPVGDRVEITALKQLLDEAGATHTCHIGSIKANIGHTKAAAGAVGLMKAAMALEHKILPPHTNWQTPNPAFGRPLTNLRPSEGGPWESEGPRRAAVSAFGFGGANTHVTLEEVDPDRQPLSAELDLIGSQQQTEVIFLSASSPQGLHQQAKQLAGIAQRICQAELIDLSAALAKQQPVGNYRVAIVSEAPWHLATQLNNLTSQLDRGLLLQQIDNPKNGLFAAEARGNPRLVALFPGQGSQRLNMGKHFLKRFSSVRKLIEDCDQCMRQLTGESFQQQVYRDLYVADEATRHDWEVALHDTRLQQPAVIAASMATLQVLMQLGLQPNFAAGHSLGEISALVAGGALQPSDAVELATLRAQAMHSVAGKGDGGMAAVGTDVDTLQRLLQQQQLKLLISNYNSPRQNVVSGPVEEIDSLLKICEQQAVWTHRLPVSHAFHSAAVAPAADTLRTALAEIPLTQLQGATVYSTATANQLSIDTNLRELLAEQIVRPVRFLEVIEQIDAEQPDLWVEVGPGQTLSMLAKDILGTNRIECFATDLAQEDGFHLLNRLLARAYVSGFPVRTERLFDERFHRDFDPTHYNPVLIVNPCERPVKPLEQPLTLSTQGLPVELMPEQASASSFARYLAQRGDFLNQYINLDYQNWPGSTDTATAAPPTENPTVAEVAATKQAETEDRTTLDLVIDWIVERTGYPREFVTPDKRLRDDLNLDSIKAGELALMLSKQMDRELPVDLGVVANASIEYLVNSVMEFQGQRITTDDSLTGNWLKSFGVALMLTPLAQEQPLEMPISGTFYIISQNPNCARSQAVAEALSNNRVDVQLLTLQQALDEPMQEIPDGLILILREQQQCFYDIVPDQFKNRVEGLASCLFRLLRKLLPAITERNDFRLLIVRPQDTTNTGSDLDGAAGLLKTLSLEYANPDHCWKWLSLPGEWEPATLAACTLQELRYRGERIEYHYSSEGNRLSPTAVQIAESTQPAPRLGGLDTLLVSGGGKGITFELAFALAQKTGIKLGLLGSSPLPKANDTTGELATNLQRLKGKGIRHLYLPTDITDHEAVQQAVKQIERRLGRVRAILHGAGISRFAEFHAMALEDYLHCIRVKTTGLYNLLRAVPPRHLKALHVISSVLGRTGMHRQADYCFANAWLDSASAAVQRRHPRLHGFSVGYSVWEGTGIGAKSGSLDMLQKIGVTPITITQGVKSYLRLATSCYPYSTFVYTGRLNPKLEQRLMPSLRLPAWRFLENVRRFVPGVELVSEATLTHAKDRYLPEHVFAGTPLMPTVMGLEAMVQAAMACSGIDSAPAIHQVVLKRPMIIPEKAGSVVRTLALCEPTIDGVTHVVVRMRSDSDGFSSDHFEIRCLFGLPRPDTATLPQPPPFPKQAYQKRPEAFAPSPLFQGKLLRRISRIFEISKGEQTLTELTVPDQAHYYNEEFSQQTQTPSPAIRDSMLQSAALMAPTGYLPESIGEIRFFRPLQGGEKLTCWTRGITREEDSLSVDILLFDQQGNPVEWMQGLVVKATSTVVDLESSRQTRPLDPDRIEQSLKRVVTGLPLSLAMVHNLDLLQDAALKLLPIQERESVLSQVSEPRRESNLANLLATRKSALKYFRDIHRIELSPSQVSIEHETGGKPRLKLVASGEKVPEANISLTDSQGTSAALIGQQPVGIDIEWVESRDAETWQGLLGTDGYDLALRLRKETGESFDASATRVWTLIEAGKKANDLQRCIPHFNCILEQTWLLFDAPLKNDGQLLSSILQDHGNEFVVSLATKENPILRQEQHYG